MCGAVSQLDLSDYYSRNVSWRDQLMVNRFSDMGQESEASQISPPRSNPKWNKRTPHYTVLPNGMETQ